MNTTEVLQQYWGYKSFRPLQHEIIKSVLEGKDTLALLPTGGGKSICFQVPGMVQDGICIVISPLIALMKDQVAGLISRDIPVRLLISGMSYREIDQALDDCVYDNIKFLYLSPERLGSGLVKERIKRMKVNLVAVDEAHCISQWGYDFRPSYLQISGIRDLLPKGVPILALTATATVAVSRDIEIRLGFKVSNIQRKSFYRDNLYYSVARADDKLKTVIRALQRTTAGSAIVYVRTRKQASDIAAQLGLNGLNAGFYHAGLEMKEREKIQTAWITGRLRIIVATNAFGMGIDKPDVRQVIHFAPPQNLESFYQEAGRAGRDEARAESLLVYNSGDLTEAERLFTESFPPIASIRGVYQALAEFYQVGIGQGEGQNYNFDLGSFCRRSKLKNTEVLTSMKIMERNGLIFLSDAILNPSRLKFTTGQEGLNRYNQRYPGSGLLVQAILRAYGGIFENDMRISEAELSRSTGIPENEICLQLQVLNDHNLIRYAPRTELPQFGFISSRVESRYLQINFTDYQQKKESQRAQLDAMLEFIVNTSICRNRLLLGYFGETTAVTCGRCDVCLSNELNADGLETIRHDLLFRLQHSFLTLEQLAGLFPSVPEKQLIQLVRDCIDAGQITQRGLNLHLSEL